MKMFKIIVVSLILATIATFALMNQWYAKNIRVTFNAESTKDFNYQIFYTDTQDGKFNGNQSVKKLVSAGLNQVKIVLPTEKIVQFRIDFGSFPGTVYISDLKVVGDKEINILGDKEENYWFSRDMEEHQFTDDKALRITSNKGDPYIVYKEKLDVVPGVDINYHNLILIVLGTFFIAFILGLLLIKKKAEKPTEETNKKSKAKK